MSKDTVTMSSDQLYLRKNGWQPAKYDVGFWRKDGYGTRTFAAALRIQRKISAEEAEYAAFEKAELEAERERLKGKEAEPDHEEKEE